MIGLGTHFFLQANVYVLFFQSPGKCRDATQHFSLFFSGKCCDMTQHLLFFSPRRCSTVLAQGACAVCIGYMVREVDGQVGPYLAFGPGNCGDDRHRLVDADVIQFDLSARDCDPA